MRRAVAVLALAADTLRKDRRERQRKLGDACLDAAAELRGLVEAAPLAKARGR